MTDTDSPIFKNGVLTVDFTLHGGTAGRLSIRDQGAGDTNITLTADSTVAYGSVTIGTYSGGTDAVTPLVINLSENVTFENVSPDLTQGTRNVRFVVSDGAGGTRNLFVAAIYFRAQLPGNIAEQKIRVVHRSERKRSLSAPAVLANLRA